MALTFNIYRVIYNLSKEFIIDFWVNQNNYKIDKNNNNVKDNNLVIRKL